MPRVEDLGPFKLLDVAATCDAAGREVVLAVVNRDPERAIPTTVQLADGAVVAEVVAYELNGADPSVVNSFERPDAVGVREQRLSPGAERFEYTYPAHSVTLLRLRVGLMRSPSPAD
jgi:alpha-N-arabinofuranosidase